jgi:hypothetical protein
LCCQSTQHEKVARSGCLALSYAKVALASGAYDFTVILNSDVKREIVHARLKYGDIDPGKEIAKAYIANKERGKHGDAQNVEVVDYQPGMYPEAGEVDEQEVHFTTDDIFGLANALGKGDVVGFAAGVAGVAVGVGVDGGTKSINLIKNPGAELQKSADDVKNGANAVTGVVGWHPF